MEMILFPAGSKNNTNFQGLFLTAMFLIASVPFTMMHEISFMQGV